uniref:ORF2 protein n=1 Tax=Torque teno virus TaxID=68887 RepID=Q6W4Y5_9VIRU|nr:ORF2 protein [Torque teno virus]
MTWRPPIHNAADINKQFFKTYFQCHNNYYNYNNFINHLNILTTHYNFTKKPAPPNNPQPAPQIRPALPAPKPDPEAENREPWRRAGSGNNKGAATKNPGAAAGDAYDGEDLDALFAAVAEDAE